MLLLIRVINAGVGVDGLQFTFHYASTYTRISLAVSSFTLYLHSTMLLLILIFTSAFLPVLPIFTFHYASTYTLRNVALPVPGLHLHSTMLLLILNCFHSHTLHINIYIPLCFYLYFQSCQQSRLNYNIYIPLCFYLYEYANSCIASFYTFTFHYASTYTTAARTAPCASCIIYIPLCFYLYAVFYDALKLSDNIYIPLCFYLYDIFKRCVRVLFCIYIPLCFYLYAGLSAEEMFNMHLHSTMLLLIHVSPIPMFPSSSYLHSTMLLLIRCFI